MTRALPAAPMTDESAEERRRRLARERQKRQRRREQDGSCPFRGEAPARILDALVCAGLLSDEALADPQAIGAALVEIARDFASVGGRKQDFSSRRDVRLECSAVQSGLKDMESQRGELQTTGPGQ